jgi:Fe-S cluster assembly protein SufD
MTGLLSNLNSSEYKYSPVEEWFKSLALKADLKPELSGDHLFFDHTDLHTGEFSQYHQAVQLGSGVSEFKVLENKSLGDFTYGIVQSFEFHLKENATLNLITLHDESSESISLVDITFHLAKGATVKHWHLSIGGKKIRTNVKAHLHDESSHYEVKSLYLTDDDEHADLQTTIFHHHSHTTSTQVAKNILGGTSHGIFTGRIVIDSKAVHVEAKQLHRTLLMSKKAQIHSEPQLEIKADDVKCSHGSSTGMIDQEQLFYLSTRGIPPQKATALLSQAFAQELFMNIPDEKWAHKIQTKLLQKLLQLGGSP